MIVRDVHYPLKELFDDVLNKAPVPHTYRLALRSTGIPKFFPRHVKTFPQTFPEFHIISGIINESRGRPAFTEMHLDVQPDPDGPLFQCCCMYG